PVPTQTPTDTERTCGMTSVITRTPFGRDVNSMSRTVVAEGVRVDKRSGVPAYFVTFLAGFCQLLRAWRNSLPGRVSPRRGVSFAPGGSAPRGYAGKRRLPRAEPRTG